MAPVKGTKPQMLIGLLIVPLACQHHRCLASYEAIQSFFTYNEEERGGTGEYVPLILEKGGFKSTINIMDSWPHDKAIQSIGLVLFASLMNMCPAEQ
jgi:hypothetical protein